MVNVPTYEKITYQDLYANTALKVTKEQGKVNYEITFHPDANANAFQLKFTGITALEMFQNGGFMAKNHIGKTEFEKPIGKRKTGEEQFAPVNVTLNKIGNNIISITIQNYQTNKEYIINIGEKKVNPHPTPDPASTDCYLRWSTYYGGSLGERRAKIETDNAGNIYVIGSTNSPNFPLQNGIDEVFSGIFFAEAFVLKFDAARERKWATFYGGSNVEEGNAIAIDEQGYVYFTGFTRSTDFPYFDAFPGITDYFQSTLQGGNNAYIVKLNSAGNEVKWATYFGLSGSNFGTSLALSASSIYLTGYINTPSSQVPFPSMVPPGYVQTNAGGSSDGFIAKFNKPTFAHEWSTYFGGSGGDKIFDCTFDNGQNVLIVAGQTNSVAANACNPVDAKFPLCNPGGSAFAEGNHGGLDAFIAKFRNNNDLQWSTQYGGSANEAPSVYFSVTTDFQGSMYFSGTTASNNFPVFSTMPGAYQQSDGISDDGFLIKFLNTGERVWSTYYAGNSQDEIKDIAVDNNGDIFFTGMTKSKIFPKKNIPGPSAYNQANLNQGSNTAFSDGFIAWLNKDLKLKWSTFYGGDDLDEGMGIAVDPATNSLVVVGRTRTLQGQFPFPLKNPGGSSYFDSNLGGFDDVFISDFSLCPVFIPRLAGNSQEDNESEMSVTENRLIYPNPANSTLHLQGFEKTQIKIYNIMGEVIYSGLAIGNTMTINVKNFAKGMYVVQTDDGISNRIQKIIIE